MTEHLALKLFLCGFGGSVAIEVVTLYQVYMAGDASGNISLPLRYKRLGFWVVRFVIALMAGALPEFYHTATSIMAIQIGASTPLILQVLGSAANIPRPNVTQPQHPTIEN